EATYQQQSHLFGHSALQFRRRQCVSFFDGRRDAEVADNARRFVPGAYHISSRGKPFARSRPFAQPLVQRRMNAVGEPRDVVLGGERLRREHLLRSAHPSHGAFRFNRARTFADGLTGESSKARNRAWAFSSKKKVR